MPAGLYILTVAVFHHSWLPYTGEANTKNIDLTELLIKWVNYGKTKEWLRALLYTGEPG